jgi:NTP pyrophosphatase (non-canonical NTP hydrolase)
MELPKIPKDATVPEWQTYMAHLVKYRGWDQASDLEIFLLLTEEVGELAKAYRRHRALFTEQAKSREQDTKEEVAGELADVFSYLLDIAQRLDIDLEKAMIEKEHQNRKREWS